MEGWGCHRPDVFVDVFADQLKGIALEWAVAVKLGHTTTHDYVSWQPRVRVNEVNEPGNTVWWLTIWGNGVQEFSPLTDWNALGKLMDDYDLTVTTTSRDHPDHRFAAFCPDPNWANGRFPGRGYAADKKTALLRAVLRQGHDLQEMVTFEVPLDLVEFSKSQITDKQYYGAHTSTGEPLIMHLRNPPVGFEDIAVDNEF